MIMKPFLLSALGLVVFSTGLQAQQVDAPVPFVRVTPGEVEYDPWQSTVSTSKFQGKITYDDQASNRSR